MSKLYNTLEKIRTGEQGVFSKKKSASAKGFGPNADKAGKRRIILLCTAGMVVLALVVFLVFPQRKDAKPPITGETVTADVVAPAGTSSQPAAPDSLDDNPQKMATGPNASLTASPTGTDSDIYQQLNDKGLALIDENQHWRGIYFLELAHKQQPERVEALINLAVAAAELGLRAPAKRLFIQAHALAPHHPLLRKNLDLLGQAEFFDDQWVASLFAGPAQPGQTTQQQ
ncbi:MAG: hypothetical protein FP813_13345 [Desulfurivibrio sp.]|nr:hypothetical protein [Desulfurivibrio sp.]MBU4117785.1 hypothetical protein [Pseudomonadota bacterium]